MPMNAADWARAYIRRGWPPVPVPFREKAPRLGNHRALTKTRRVSSRRVLHVLEKSEGDFHV